MTRTRVGRTWPRRLRTVAGILAFVLPAALTQAVPAEATVLKCGDSIVSGRPLTVTLDNDLNCPSGYALTMNPDNAFLVTLDLAGHTVAGSILVYTASRVLVKNGRLSGLTASDSTTVTLTDVRGVKLTIRNRATVTANGTPSTCEIDSINLTQARLTADDCTLHGGTFYQGTPTVRSSVVSNGRLSFTDSGNGLFTGNVFDNAPVEVGWESVDFIFRNNVFKNAGTALDMGGVARGPWSSGTVENNEFNDNSIGMHAAPYFDTMTVRNNTFARNTTVGLYIDNRVTPRQSYPVSDNVFLDNGQAPSGATDRWGDPLRGGLHVVNSSVENGPPYLPAITLTRNTGSGNADYLIWASSRDVIDGGGNQGPCKPGDVNLICS